MGPGRVELPTSRLSGVRSNQLSYEPWKNPTSALCCKTGQPQLVRTSVFTYSLSKEQQKNRCFTASGSETFIQVFHGSQSLNLQVIRTRFKSRLPFTGDYSSSTDSGYSTALSSARQGFFTFFHRYTPYLFTHPPALGVHSGRLLGRILTVPGDRISRANGGGLPRWAGNGLLQIHRVSLTGENWLCLYRHPLGPRPPGPVPPGPAGDWLRFARWVYGRFLLQTSNLTLQTSPVLDTRLPITCRVAGIWSKKWAAPPSDNAVIFYPDSRRKS